MSCAPDKYWVLLVSLFIKNILYCISWYLLVRPIPVGTGKGSHVTTDVYPNTLWMMTMLFWKFMPELVLWRHMHSVVLPGSETKIKLDSWYHIFSLHVPRSWGRGFRKDSCLLYPIAYFYEKWTLWIPTDSLYIRKLV